MTARGGARQGAGRKRSNTDLDIIKLHLAVERIQRLRGRNCSRRDALRQLKEEGSITKLHDDLRGRYNLERYLTPKYIPQLGRAWLIDPKLRVGIISQLSGFNPNDPW